MKLAVSAVTTAPKAAPMTTPTAKSTTLPRRMNFLKPSMVVPPRRCGRSRHLTEDGTAVGSAIDENAGVENSRRIEGPLRRRQCFGEEIGPLRVVPRSVVATHRVVMRDRATGREHRVACRRLDLRPLRELAAASCRREDGEVRRGAVDVGVCDSARHDAVAAHLAHRRL